MLDSSLGKMILRRISMDSAACCQALEGGVITIADLDHKHEPHQEGVQEWLELRWNRVAPIPPVWLSVLGSKYILRLSAVMPEAQARMAKVIREGFNIEKLFWHEPAYPPAWANAIEKVLLDKPSWDAFHAVQDKLPVNMVARLRKELASKIAAKEQEEKEQKRAARGASQPKVDPLAASIRNRDEKRLSKLPLEKLSRVRWEAYKDEWMKAPADIVSLAAKVPVEFTRPYETKILAAVADQGWPSMPKWIITKSCLQELEVRDQMGFLRQMFRALIEDATFNSVEPEYTWQEIRNLLVASTLQDPDNINLSRWIDGLDTVKYLRSLKSNGCKLSKEEEAQFRLAAPTDNNYFNLSEWFCGEADTDDSMEVELALDLLAWVKNQPKEKHPCYAALLRNSEGLKELFGGALKASIK